MTGLYSPADVAYAMRDNDMMAGAAFDYGITEIVEFLAAESPSTADLQAMCLMLAEALQYLLRNKKLTDRNVRYRNLVGEAMALCEKTSKHEHAKQAAAVGGAD